MNNLSFPSNSGGVVVLVTIQKMCGKNMAASNGNRDLAEYYGGGPRRIPVELTQWQGVSRLDLLTKYGYDRSISF